MARIRNIILIALLLMAAITACSTEKRARRDLERMNIAYTEDSFFTHLREGDKKVVDLFLTAGMSPNLEMKYNDLPIFIAISKGYDEILKLLIEKGADVNAKNKDGTTPLMEATTLGKTAAVRILVDKGADVNTKNKDGMTALMEAASVGKSEVVKILIDKGADINTKNNNEITALILAKLGDHTEIISHLEKAGATMPKDATERLLAIADTEIQNGHYDHAIKSYKTILSFDPQNSEVSKLLKDAEDIESVISNYREAECCIEAIKRYRPVELTHNQVEEKFKKWSEDNEFERKKQAREQKEFLSKKETYFSIEEDLATSEYDFKKQRFIVTVGSKTGKKRVPGGEIIIVPYALLIVNKDGGEIKLPWYIDEGSAASFAEIKKKLFIIYKLMNVKDYSYYDPIEAQIAGEMGFRGRGGWVPGYHNSVRRYIKPLHVALLIGNGKYVLYEEKKTEQIEQKKDYKKNMKKK